MTRDASGSDNLKHNSLASFLADIVVQFDDGDEGEEGGDGTDGSADGSEGDEGSSGEEGTGSSGDGSNDDIKDPEKKRLSDEAAKYRTERNDMKAELDEARKRLKEIDDADKSELEKAQSDLADAQAETDKLRTQVRDQAIELAFFTSGAASLFKNAATARRLMDLDSLKVDEDGKVDDKAVKKMAEDLLKSEPYLAASEGEGSSGDKEGGSPSNRRRKSGDDASKEKLKAKYPALASRV